MIINQAWCDTQRPSGGGWCGKPCVVYQPRAAKGGGWYDTQRQRVAERWWLVRHPEAKGGSSGQGVI